MINKRETEQQQQQIKVFAPCEHNKMKNGHAHRKRVYSNLSVYCFGEATRTKMREK